MSSSCSETSVDTCVIAIGRNEGERLRRSLNALTGCGGPRIYVDSGSCDGSPQLAREAGFEVLELDASRPHTAARARNDGLHFLVSRHAGLRFVQFVDGDCELLPGWLKCARGHLIKGPEICAVTGHLNERFREAGLLNQLCALEWLAPVGEVGHCGGTAMFRIRPLLDVGGFRADLLAGEEPELCSRLREAGGHIVRIDRPMAVHDSGAMGFTDWWRRARRLGYASLDVLLLTRRRAFPVYRRKVWSTLGWTVGWGLLLGAQLTVGVCAKSGLALGVSVLIGLLPIAQIARITIRTRKQGHPFWLSVANGCLTMLGKWAQLLGMAKRLFRGRCHAAAVAAYAKPGCPPVSMVPDAGSPDKGGRIVS